MSFRCRTASRKREPDHGIHRAVGSLPVSSSALVACILLAACGAEAPDLERMLEQQRSDPYEASEFFADEKVLQHPPAGAVPRERIAGRLLLTRGMADGGYAERVPITITPELIRLGERRFTVFCAVCHGERGRGRTVVAANMGGVPSLRTPEVRRMPPGMIYRHIVDGPGRMPSYEEELDVRERWAVVAYLRRLQNSGDEGARGPGADAASGAASSSLPAAGVKLPRSMPEGGP